MMSFMGNFMHGNSSILLDSHHSDFKAMQREYEELEQSRARGAGSMGNAAPGRGYNSGNPIANGRGGYNPPQPQYSSGASRGPAVANGAQGGGGYTRDARAGASHQQRGPYTQAPPTQHVAPVAPTLYLQQCVPIPQSFLLLKFADCYYKVTLTQVFTTLLDVLVCS